MACVCYIHALKIYACVQHAKRNRMAIKVAIWTRLKLNLMNNQTI